MNAHQIEIPYRRKFAKRRLSRANWARFLYVCQHPEFWRPYRLTPKTLRCLFGMMQVAGLYGQSTNMYDTQLQHLVVLARAQPRSGRAVHVWKQDYPVSGRP